jgi:hypothetical protein
MGLLPESGPLEKAMVRDLDTQRKGTQSRGQLGRIALDCTTAYPVVYAGPKFNRPAPSFAVDIIGMTRSAVAGVGRVVSNGESGFLIRVTQKHLAILSSPLMRATLRPRS